MRKIIVSNFMTLDGFLAGPAGELDWFIWNTEAQQHARLLVSSADTLLFGRVTYELMAGYWPTATPPEDDADIIAFMNDSRKIVFSRTLRQASWHNSTVLETLDAGTINDLKSQPGKEIVIFGSGTLVGQLTQMGLVDDYRIFVHPVVLGGGKPMFASAADRRDLSLTEARPLSDGVVLLSYRPVGHNGSAFARCRGGGDD